MRLKPLTHWIIYRGYRVRFTRRATHEVSGILTTPSGAVPFTYLPESRTVIMDDRQITIDEHGWEVADPGDGPDEPRKHPA